MENNELEEMRSQLSVLNGKLENETIVSDTMLSNATKKSISQMQKKLLIRIAVAAVLAYFIDGFLGHWFLYWLLGAMVLNIFIYFRVRKIKTQSMNVADNSKYIHKTLKIYKRCRTILFVFFALFLVFVGILNLIYFWGTEKGIEIFCYCILFDIFLASLYYVIDDVFVQPDVVITLEGIIKDLES